MFYKIALCVVLLSILVINFPSLYPVRDLTEIGNALIENRKTSENYEKALSYLNQAYEKEPRNIFTIYNLANAYHYQGEYPKAKTLYQKAIDLSIEQGNDELLGELNYNLGNTYYKQYLFGEAVEAYQSAMDKYEDDLQIKKNYELAFRKLEENKHTQPNPQDNKNQKNQEEDKNHQEGSGTEASRSQNPSDPDQPDPAQDEQDQNPNQADQASSPGRSQDNRDQSPTDSLASTETISLERAEQILNSYQNHQKKFEAFRKYKQNLSSQPNSKNW